jgi:hypothetical protein
MSALGHIASGLSSLRAAVRITERVFQTVELEAVAAPAE